MSALTLKSDAKNEMGRKPNLFITIFVENQYGLKYSVHVGNLESDSPFPGSEIWGM